MPRSCLPGDQATTPWPSAANAGARAPSRPGTAAAAGLSCRALTPQAVCQPLLRRAAPECPVRTSLDLELDLQASLTRQSRLNDELQALRGLRQRLEELKAQGETDLPPGVLDDERFQKLLRQAGKQVRGAPERLPAEGASLRPRPAQVLTPSTSAPVMLPPAGWQPWHQAVERKEPQHRAHPCPLEKGLTPLSTGAFSSLRLAALCSGSSLGHELFFPVSEVCCPRLETPLCALHSDHGGR